MFPLLLAVLYGDSNRGVPESLVRTVSIRGNIPKSRHSGVLLAKGLQAACAAFSLMSLPISLSRPRCVGYLLANPKTLNRNPKVRVLGYLPGIVRTKRQGSHDLTHGRKGLGFRA